MSIDKVLVNKGRSKAFVRLYDNLDIKKPLFTNDYIELGSITEDAIKYYNQLKAIGVHIVDTDKFFKSIEKTEKPEQVIPENLDEIDEDNIEDTTEEDNIEDTTEEDTTDEDTTEYSLESDIKEMSEEEIRDLAKKMDIGNYWNKKLGNLVEDILEEDKK